MAIKDTGIHRPVDELGRVVIPKELRRTMGINEKDSLEVFVDGDMIVLKKYEPGCIFCGEMEGLITHKGKSVCPDCLAEMPK